MLKVYIFFNMRRERLYLKETLYRKYIYVDLCFDVIAAIVYLSHGPDLYYV